MASAHGKRGLTRSRWHQRKERAAPKITDDASAGAPAASPAPAARNLLRYCAKDRPPPRLAGVPQC
jgi:hypothetical protein